MGLSRRGSRGEAPIWPGFVDAMSSLLLVLMFVVTIFLIVQFVLRQTITVQGTQLDALNAQVQSLADALGLARTDAAKMKAQLSDADAKAKQQDALIATLNGQLAQKTSDLSAAQAKITDFEQQVASQELLTTMNARQDLQLKLQSTVEGLSVAAITYYIVGLVAYLAKGAEKVGWPVAPEITAALAIPAVAFGVWWSLRRLHHRLFKG